MKWFLNLFILSLSLGTYAQSTEWRITRPTWTVQDERAFGEFVSRIGAAVERRACQTVDGCLRGSANPYASSDPGGLRLYADCADLPYLLRSYFAWKNGLPMSVESAISARRVEGNGGDIRYTPFGNYVSGRYDILARNSSGRWDEVWSGIFGTRYPNAVSLLNGTITDVTFSGSYRMIGVEDSGLYTDFYPVKIDRDGIRPGTVIYDPNGHVTIVYKVTDDGHIFYIDSHPDNTLTSGMYNQKFVRSNPYQGAGFKNFRPLALVGAKLDSNNAYVGGQIIAAKNNQLASYSLEQFYGNSPDPGGAWSKGQFLYNGKPISYYDYVRIQMASGPLRIDPVQDLRQNVADICNSLKDRVVAIDTAIKSGLQNNDHPLRLPLNIYGSDGDWENYASPARDARLKVTFMELLNQSQSLIQRYKAGDPTIVYSGKNLPQDLLQTYQNESRTCQISYTNSDGRRVTLNLEQIRQRLFDLSFDPYHCVELRWGARNSQELASCRDDNNKMAWYRQERWLRYQYERRYDVRMDYSLEELDGPKPGAGIAAPPNVDIVGFLSAQK